MPRPKQRTPELRDQVLKVALSTLNEDGLSGFTTRRGAELAGTSVPAVYELFGDKSGLVRAVFFEGFRMLARQLLAVPETDDAVADMQRLIPVFRRFCLDSPAMAPSVRELFGGRIKRCPDSGLLTGDPVDIAHVLLALAQGLAVQEGGRWLGKSKASVNRRWEVGVTGILRGFAR